MAVSVAPTLPVALPVPSRSFAPPVFKPPSKVSSFFQRLITPVGTDGGPAASAVLETRINAIVIAGEFFKIAAITATVVCLISSFVINPLLLTALIPIVALGALGVCLSDARIMANGKFYIPGITPGVGFFVAGQPLGLRNISNNCWANALMQMVMQVPSLQAAVNTLPSEFEPLRLFTQNYRDNERLRYMVAERASSQSIRECLHQRGNASSSNTVISNHAYHQEDAAEALALLLTEIRGESSPLFNRVHTFNHNGVLRTNTLEWLLPVDLFNHNQRPVDSATAAASTPTASATPQATAIAAPTASATRQATFAELIQDYFYHLDGYGNLERRQYTALPQELIVQMNRFSNTMVNGAFVPYKYNESIPTPLRFTIQPNYVISGQGGDMECDAFIEHIGATLDIGHYVVFLKGRNGTWWRCSDMNIMPVSESEIQAAIQRSYILHYRRA